MPGPVMPLAMAQNVQRVVLLGSASIEVKLLLPDTIQTAPGGVHSIRLSALRARLAAEMAAGPLCIMAGEDRLPGLDL